MRRKLSAVMIALLGVSILCTLVFPVFAQVTTSPSPDVVSQQQLIVRWMRFRGSVTLWGDEPYQGSVVVTAKTANVPAIFFRPFVTINAVWSNEQRPMASTEKPVGAVTYTHYTARLVLLQAVRGKLADPAFNLNVTGLWNVNKVTITRQFDEDGALVKSTREVTPVVARAKGQLHITDDWKKFDIQIQGVETIEGNGLTMRTTRNVINPFSFSDLARPTIQDLFQLVRCYRAMPGFGNYIPEVDYNMDSKIDLKDLTTVAANM